MFSPRKKRRGSREPSETREGEKEKKTEDAPEEESEEEPDEEPGEGSEQAPEKRKTPSAKPVRITKTFLVCGSRSGASGSRSSRQTSRSRSVPASSPSGRATGASASTAAGVFIGTPASPTAGTSSGTRASTSTSTHDDSAGVSTTGTPAVALTTTGEMNEIIEADLVKLATEYDKKYVFVPYGRSMATHGKHRLLPSGKLMEEWTIEFKSPGNAWKVDGTFFVFMEYGGKYEVAIFTLGEKGLNTIYCGLMYSCRIQYQRPVVFKNIHENIYPTVMRSIREKKLKVLSEKTYIIYQLSKSDALRRNSRIPENVEVKEIQTVQADMVYATWTEYYPDSVEYVRTLVRMNGGFVAISKPEGKQLAWLLKSVMGQIDFVETKRESYRKGYASLLIKLMAKQIAIEGNDTIAFVPTTNATAQKLFEKIGFDNVGLCHDIEVIDAPEATPSPTSSLPSSPAAVKYSTLKNSFSFPDST